LGVGSSTFALVNFIVALRDGVIDESEKRLMHVVYFVLRIGMVCIGLSLLGLLVYDYVISGGRTFEYIGPKYLMQLTLLAVITINAILMTLHKMPMRYGPVIAGGSWYSLFWVTELPLQGATYLTYFLYYAAFVVVFFIVFEAAK